MSELLISLIEEIINYCKGKKFDAENMDFLLIVDDRSESRIKSIFEAAKKIEDLMEEKKAHSSIIVFDKKEGYQVVGIRFGDDGTWYLEKKSDRIDKKEEKP